MFTFTYAQLNAWITAFLWPFVRILALVASAPILGHTSVPMRVKIGLAAFMAVIIAPTLGAMPQATVFSADGTWILVNQVLIGLALGFVMQIVFGAVEMAGGIIGLGMGLGFATLIDPNANGSTDVTSMLLNMIASLVFLTLDGHLQVISALVMTFQSLPVDANVLAASGWRLLAQYGATLFAAGVLLSLPVVAALLIANLCLGILNRAAPQIGIFQVGFPLTMLVGLLLIQLMLPNMIPFFGRMFDNGLEEMGRLALTLRPTP